MSVFDGFFRFGVPSTAAWAGPAAPRTAMRTNAARIAEPSDVRVTILDECMPRSSGLGLMRVLEPSWDAAWKPLEVRLAGAGRSSPAVQYNVLGPVQVWD